MNKRQLKKGIGAVMAAMGMMLAVCTADGSEHELLMRGIGVALLALGAWMAEAYCWQTGKGRVGNATDGTECSEM